MNHFNMVSYSLLCNHCNKKETNLASHIENSESFVGYSRQELLNVCHDIFINRPCTNCGTRGKYSVFEIYCEERPKQIHIQMQIDDGYLGVDIFNEDGIHLGDTLERLPPSDPLCHFLSRAVLKIDSELSSILESSQGAINDFTNNPEGERYFYTIYEERIGSQFIDSNKGDLVFLENNFGYSELNGMLNFIEKNKIFKN